MSVLSAMPNKQVAGGFLSVEWLHHPERALPHLRRAAERGYGAWFCVARHMRPDLFDPEVKEALRVIVGLAHDCGLKFILDTDPTHWAERCTARDYNARLESIIPVAVNAEGGHFEAFVSEPSTRQSTIVNISKAYSPAVPDRPMDMVCEWHSVRRPFRGYRLAGRIGDYTGPAKIYVSASTNHLLDHASGTCMEMQSELLRMYADLPLDGIAWDEPGKGHGSLTSFRSGRDFLAWFRRANGYDLMDKLPRLDGFDDTPEAVKVRCDYYRTWSDIHFHIQKKHFDEAKSIWGSDIILGTHPTWAGLPLDLSAGVFDHFRLSETLSEAWTDGGCHLERKVHMFTFILADSIKKTLNYRNAYYNNWIDQYHPSYYWLLDRIKMLWHVNSFEHDYSDFTEGHVPKDAGAFKAIIPQSAKILNDFDAAVGTRRSVSDFAVWYGWEGYAALPHSFARCDYVFMQNFSLAAADAGVWFDFVDTKSLFAGAVLDGRLTTAAGSYAALVMPYARVLPTGLWEKLLAWNRTGLKIVFVGPEPAFDAGGKAIDFAAEAGFRSRGPASWLRGIAAKGYAVAPDAGEPPFLDVTPSVDVVDDAKAVVHRNEFGEITTLRNGRGLYWQPGLDPREDLVGLLAPWRINPLECFGPFYARLFGTSKDGIVVVAPKAGCAGMGLTPYNMEKPSDIKHEIKFISMDGVLVLNGGLFRLRQCQWAVLRATGEESLSVLNANPGFTLTKGTA